ncbi:hypothetical protein EVA_15315 [gut metagenome]|uniref:Uncharacterized protein n=1 Tax=gut metagenome TaxID=749906 RepID=J9GB05_9ZZZZ
MNINTAGVISMKTPTTRSITFISVSITIGLSLTLKSIELTVCGMFS